ncbi:MAG: sodium transporter, partial [Planctomycetes bacterium]|nr:sodium transporter [Planctomycetota bacterium]
MAILAAAKLAGPDYFILVGYFILMLGIGAYFYRYMKGMKDYFSGNNKIPWWLSGISFYMSCFSAFGFIAYSTLAFKYGLVAVNIWWFGVPALILSIVLLAKKWRRMRIDSPVEYLESRYSPSIRQIFAWQGLPVRIIDDALKLVAIAIFISKVFDVDLINSMLFSGLIMLAYTMMGGLWAVVVTDFVQFVVMAVAVIVLVPLSINEAGGLWTFFSAAPEGFFKMTNSEYDWFYILMLILLMFLGYSSVNWGLIQRYYCVPKEKDVYKLGILVVVLEIVGPPLILLPAMAARHFMPEANASDIYPMLCLRLLPVGMIGLIIAAMFSATMSMLSSDYNAAASVLTNDIYKRV